MIRERQTIHQVAADPELQAQLARIPRHRANASLRKPAGDRTVKAHSIAAFLAREMRRILDQDPTMAAVPTSALRAQDRSAYLIRFRARAIAVLRPHFSDEQIARFMGRCRSAITHLRNKA